MSLIDLLKAEEDRKNKLFHEISTAASFLTANITKAKNAKTLEDHETAIKNALEDAKLIENMALSVVTGTHKK